LLFKSWVLLRPTRTSVTKYPCGNLTWNIQAELHNHGKDQNVPPPQNIQIVEMIFQEKGCIWETELPTGVNNIFNGRTLVYGQTFATIKLAN